MRKYRFHNAVLRIIFTFLLKGVPVLDNRPGGLISYKLINGYHVGEGQRRPEGIEDMSFFKACTETKRSIKCLLQNRKTVFLRVFPEWDGHVVYCRFVVSKH